MANQNPIIMTADKRLKEIAMILALGFLRYRQNALDSIDDNRAICEPKT